MRQKAAVSTADAGLASLSTVSSSSGWWPIIREAFAGAWQRNIEYSTESVLSFSAVYACVTLIASDVAKMRVRLVQQGADDIWTEIKSAAFSPVLRKPNRYQTRIGFVQQWLTSKLIHGNAYILKERDNRGVVVALYVLDPQRVKPLVASDGSVYYSLGTDNLPGIDRDVVVPASEIIHDVMVALYHPLCGVSPISACGLAAAQGLRVQNHSTVFFGNGANPGGVLTAPGVISVETAKRLEDNWEANYGGKNAGRVAVLGDGLKYERMAMSAVDAQLIDQLKWTAENVCTAFHVPPYMIGVGATPTYNNIEALNQQYYAQCLQIHIESIELLLDEGLGLDVQTPAMGTEFDLDALLRMDSATQIKTLSEGVVGGLYKPNEARKKLNLSKVEGGDAVYLQQQNFSIEALAKRDAKADPFETAAAKSPEPSAPPAPAPTKDIDLALQPIEALFRKALAA